MLMEGITIINQTEIMSAPEWVFNTGMFLLTLTGIAIIIGLIFSIIYTLTQKSIVNILAIFTMIIAAICAIASGVFMTVSMLKPMQTVPTGEYRYEVTVDDNITYKNYKAFRDKYEIIEEKENSLIVEEKGES